MNFLSKLAVKYLGPSFIRRHVTTLIGALAGYIVALGIGVEQSVIDNFVSSGSEIAVALALYAVGLAVDVKPENTK